MEIEQQHIRLIERGVPAILEEGSWIGVEQDDRWRLFQSLRVVRTVVNGRYRLLEPRQFVGSFRSNYWSIRVDPRHPEFFEALCAFVGQWPSKQAPIVDDARDASAGARADAEAAFFIAAERAINSGLPFLYSTRLVTTSRPHGRVRFTDTIRRLQSRGVRHKVVCEEPIRYGDPILRGVLGTTMVLLRDRSLPQSAPRRRLELISDIVEPTVLKTNDAIHGANHLIATYSDWPEVTLLASVCKAILTSAADIWDIQHQLDGGECRFCNIDRLWEIGLLQAFKHVGARRGLKAEFHPYGSSNVTLFDTGGPEIDPDIVVFHQGAPKIIVDAKYSIKREPDAGDVYQIVCYTSRLKARMGVLVYLADSDSPWLKELGQTAEGAKCFAAGVPLNSIATTLLSTVGEIILAGVEAGAIV